MTTQNFFETRLQILGRTDTAKTKVEMGTQLAGDDIGGTRARIQV